MESNRHRWYLLPSPLLGPSSWGGVAKALTEHNEIALVAESVVTTTAHTDHVTPWIEGILAAPTPDDDLPVIVVGHSAACPRTPLAAAKLLEAGWNVSSFVCVDGRFPDGRSFTEAGPTYGAMLDGMVRPDDYLPPWPRWWGSLIEGLISDPAARRLVLNEARPIPRSWFDQSCPVPDLPADIGRAFLCFGAAYEESRKRAAAEGWTTHCLRGDHLHPVVAPDAVTSTLLSLIACLESER